jgi:hypothetical protein
MFCLRCGEVIPDGSVVCPKCGELLSEESKSGKTAVYASKKIKGNAVSKQKFCIWSMIAVVSFFFLKLNYFKVNIKTVILGSSYAINRDISGYDLLGYLEGSVSISGYMIILLIITNIVAFVTGIIGVKGNVIKAKALKVLMLIETIAYLIATIVPYFNIKKELSVFDSSLITTTSIGAGCYLNLALAIVAAIYFMFGFCNQLKDT